MSNALLSKRQLAAITQVAHKAWGQLVIHGAESGDWRDEQDWRHSIQEQLLGAGKTSLKTATQADYPRIYNHFARMAGLTPIADKTRTPRDKALWILQDAMRKHELTPGYLADIARDKFSWPLSGYGTADIMDAIKAKLDHGQIMQLVYTINNRGRAKTRALSEATGATPDYEPHVTPDTMPPGHLSDHFGSTLTDAD